MTAIILRALRLLALTSAFAVPFAAPAQEAKSPAPATHPTTAPPGIPTSWKQIPIPTLHEFKPQEPHRIALPNGMVLFLQEDHELPLINGVIRVRGGGRDEPGEKAGLSEIYGEAWRTGGTKSKTGDELDDFLESRAAQVETADGEDSTSLSWSSLKGDFDSVFSQVLDILENPEFRQDKIDLAKKQLLSAIARRNDDVEEIAHRESAKLAYGNDNPYARTPEAYTVAAVTRDDLRAWHKRTVVPNNMILGIVGDFDSSAMEQKLRQAFADLPSGEAFPRAEITFHPAQQGIYFVQKEDVNQSSIMMVDLGTDRRNQDYYALVVMNELFGGGFASRLFSTIRTRLGLAYGVGGGVGTAFDHPGVVRFEMETKSATTATAIEALRQQISELVKSGVTLKEVKRAKDTILNAFIFQFDSKEKVLAEQIRYEFYGYPPDFLERFRAGLQKVTPADIERVARKYLHPEKLSILVVGNEKGFERGLNTLGKVIPVDVSIPQKKPGKAVGN